jgi:hypothetical protein
MVWSSHGENHQVTIVIPDGVSFSPLGGLIARFVM